MVHQACTLGFRAYGESNEDTQNETETACMQGFGEITASTVVLG